MVEHPLSSDRIVFLLRSKAGARMIPNLGGNPGKGATDSACPSTEYRQHSLVASALT